MIELEIGLIGDDHVLSLFNIQPDETLRLKFQFIAPNEWQNVIKFKIKNFGVVGDCTTDLAAKVMDENAVAQYQGLDYSIVLIGTNDVILSNPITQIIENMKKILLRLKSLDSTPVFCTLLPISVDGFSQMISDINSMMTIFCAENEICVFDVNLAFNNGEDRLDSYYDVGDGIHLSQEGYLFLADNLLLRVIEIITQEFEEYRNNTPV